MSIRKGISEKAGGQRGRGAGGEKPSIKILALNPSEKTSKGVFAHNFTAFVPSPLPPVPYLNYLRRPTYYLLSCILLTSLVTSFLGVNLTDSASSLFLIPGTTTVLFSNRPR